MVDFCGQNFKHFPRARRNVQKSTRGWPHRRVCHYDSLTAQECAKIHTGHDRRSGYGSPSAQECAKIHMRRICRKDSHVNCRARRNVQKITRRVIEKSVQLFRQRAGMCKNPHRQTSTADCRSTGTRVNPNNSPAARRNVQKSIQDALIRVT